MHESDVPATRVSCVVGTSKTCCLQTAGRPWPASTRCWRCRIAVGLNTPSSWIASVLVTRPVRLTCSTKRSEPRGSAARIRVEIGSATNVETLERTNRRGEADRLVVIEIEASERVHQSASGDAAWGRPHVVRDRRPPRAVRLRRARFPGSKVIHLG